MSVGVRPHPPPPVHFLGNATLLATTNLSIHETFEPSSLPLLALSIRQTIAKVTSNHVSDVVASMRSCSDYSKRMLRYHEVVLESGTVVTSCLSFPSSADDRGPKVRGSGGRVKGPASEIF